MNADPTDAYAAFVASLGKDAAVLQRAGLRNKLYGEVILFEMGAGNKQLPRRVLFFNDALVVARAERAGLVVCVECPWSGQGGGVEEEMGAVVVTDLLGTGQPPASSLLALEVRAQAAAAAAPSSSWGVAATLYAPDAATKELVLSELLPAALADGLPATALVQRHWLHSHVKGTLHWASLVGKADVVQALCRFAPSAAGVGVPAGSPLVSPSAADPDGFTPLHLAALGARLYPSTRTARAAVVAALLEAGADVSAMDPDFCQPLHHLVTAAGEGVPGAATLASMLVVNGAPLDARTLLEQTPLAIALQSACTVPPGAASAELCGLVGVLLSYACDTREADAEGLHPLHRVALSPLEPLVLPLARHGADPHARALVRRVQEGGGGKEESATSGGIDGDELDDSLLVDDALTPLHLACGVRLEADPRPLLHLPAGEGGGVAGGFSPLSVTPIHVGMVGALLAAGCQPNARTERTGEAPLHLLLRLLASLAGRGGEADAARAEVQACVSLLCSFGARLDVVDGAGVACGALAAAAGVTAHCEASAALYLARAAPVGGIKGKLGEDAAARRKQRQRAAAASAPRGGPAAGVACEVCGGESGGGARKGGRGLLDAAASAQLPHSRCQQCGMQVCGACSRKRFPVFRPAGADSDDDDNDDLFAPGPPRPARGKSAPKKSGGGLAGFLSALSLGGGGSSSAPADHPDLCCDGCFNGLCSLADAAEEEARTWEAEKAKALEGARNMREVAEEDDATEQRRKKALAGAAAARERAAKAPQLSADAQRSALFEGRGGEGKGAGAGVGVGAGAKVGALQAVLGDTKQRLNERGEKISRLDERTRDMSRQAEDFAAAAAQLKKKSAGWW
jgi:ankyrin repeat protein